MASQVKSFHLHDAEQNDRAGLLDDSSLQYCRLSNVLGIANHRQPE